LKSLTVIPSRLISFNKLVYPEPSESVNSAPQDQQLTAVLAERFFEQDEDECEPTR